jgi:hypothetical protein
MTSRRSVLKAAFGSAVGASAALVPVLPATSGAEPIADRRLRPALLRGARRLDAVPGAPLRPVAGDRCVVVADVVEAGQPVGVLHADVVRLHDRGQVPEHPDAATMEHHMLVLEGGTLTALGHCNDDGTGRFAITGGTGAYHAAAGSYDFSVNRADLGGDGTGRITYHLTTAREA